jgi:hypothetical protein
MRVPSSWPPDVFGADPRISAKWIRLAPSPAGDEIAVALGADLAVVSLAHAGL